jgi:hypothetical protein
VQCCLTFGVQLALQLLSRCAVMQRKVDSSLLDLQRQNDKLKEKLASASSKVGAHDTSRRCSIVAGSCWDLLFGVSAGAQQVPSRCPAGDSAPTQAPQ